jgi:hypothetical protein
MRKVRVRASGVVITVDWDEDIGVEEPLRHLIWETD